MRRFAQRRLPWHPSRQPAGLALAWLALGTTLVAQSGLSTRVSVIRAEERGATTARDLAILRAAARSTNTDTALAAVRALGRLQRSDLIADLTVTLRHRFPELRAEAAYGIGQAAQGWLAGRAAPGLTSPTTLLSTLADRLDVESDPTVRAAIGFAVGRIPYRTADDVERAGGILALLASSDELTERLGSARGLEALARRQGRLTRDGPAVDALRDLAGLGDEGSGPRSLSGAANGAGDPLRDARVRRLALAALIAGGAADAPLIARTANDADHQVRRLAMQAAGDAEQRRDVLIAGLDDPAPMVRLEALRSLAQHTPGDMCAHALAATSDPDLQVALVGFGLLASCGAWSDALIRLQHAVEADVSSPRGWHRAAHAMVALAKAHPDRARTVLPRLAGSSRWELRMYAAQAAAFVDDRVALRALAVDDHDNVAATAIDGLAAVSGHSDDALYVAALGRPSLRVLMAAALALRGTPEVAVAGAALETTLKRLAAEGAAASLPTRRELAETLAGLGATPSNDLVTSTVDTPSIVSAENLQRLAGPLARLSIRGVGTIELALLTDEAPATVLRFAELAERGAYNGLTFHRVAANLLVQGGSPSANDVAGHATSMRDELGPWPHVRGTVGAWTRGEDEGTGQFFISLVDNPAFDYEYTAFAQVLNGVELIDEIREGDIIDGVEIVP